MLELLVECVRLIMTQQSNHPEYYRSNGFEVADFIEAFNLNFNLGNVIKYVCRAGHKEGEDTISDLIKAQTYLLREISHIGKIKI